MQNTITTAAADAVHQIFSFSNASIENLQVLSDGNILLSTLGSDGRLYILDPGANQPQAKPIASFENATGLTGIAPLSEDMYAVTGGVYTSSFFEEGSMHVYIVSLEDESLAESIPVPEAATMNGLVALPNNPHVLLSADSVNGCILRINTQSKDVSIAIDHDHLQPLNSGSSPKVGVNGIRIRDNYLYFSNSDKGLFGRVSIDGNGGQDGEFEILAHAPGLGGQIYDDFILDSQGNVYITLHPHFVSKLETSGDSYTITGDETIKEPTSAAMAMDGKSVYISTAGSSNGDEHTEGQLIKITLE